MTRYINKKQLERRDEPGEQYDFYGIDDDYDNEGDLVKVSPLIGELFIAFGELEHTLEKAIFFMLSDRSDQLGMGVVKYLDSSKKIKMFNEFARQHIIYVHRGDNDKSLDALKEIVGALDAMRDLRNVVAHSKWGSYTKDGYVRNSIVMSKKDGMPLTVSYKLTAQVMTDMISSIDDTDTRLYNLLTEWGAC